MKERLKTDVRRRDLLYIAISGASVAITSAVVTEPVLAKPVNLANKRKARYQANSAEVRNYYRVNPYPAK
jgi:hypothetical protein